MMTVLSHRALVKSFWMSEVGGDRLSQTQRPLGARPLLPSEASPSDSQAAGERGRGPGHGAQNHRRQKVREVNGKADKGTINFQGLLTPPSETPDFPLTQQPRTAPSPPEKHSHGCSTGEVGGQPCATKVAFFVFFSYWPPPAPDWISRGLGWPTSHCHEPPSALTVGPCVAHLYLVTVSGELATVGDIRRHLDTNPQPTALSLHLSPSCLHLSSQLLYSFLLGSLPEH